MTEKEINNVSTSATQKILYFNAELSIRSRSDIWKYMPKLLLGNIQTSIVSYRSRQYVIWT